MVFEVVDGDDVSAGFHPGVLASFLFPINDDYPLAPESAVGLESETRRKSRPIEFLQLLVIANFGDEPRHGKARFF